MRRFEINNVVNGIRGFGPAVTATLDAIESTLTDVLGGWCLKSQRRLAFAYWQTGWHVLPGAVNRPRRQRTSPSAVRMAVPRLAMIS